MGSDGMTIDDRGNIYVTGDGVTVFDKDGQKIAHFPFLRTGQPTFVSAEKTAISCLSPPQNPFIP